MCTANSCRSQMAETWARHLFPPGWEVASCGLITYPIVRDTEEVMAEVGLSTAGQHSKTLDDFDLDTFDLVVTLSREAGRFLPPLRDPARHIPRPVADPMGAQGTEDEVKTAFREGRDRIRAVVEDVVAGRLTPGGPREGGEEGASGRDD
jgi:arsenate reductase